MSQVFKCPSCGASLDYDGGDHATVRCAYCSNTVIVPETMRSKAKNVSTLFTRSNQLKEIVDLINLGDLTEAVDLYSQTFNVSHADAHSAVNRLASGLSLAMNQMQVQSYSISNDPNIQTYRSKDKTGRNIGCLILAIVLFTFGIIIVTTIVPLVAGGAALSTLFSGEDENPFGGVTDLLSTAEASSATVEAGGGLTTIASTATPTPGPTNLLLQFGTEGIAPGQFNDARTLAVAPDGTIYVADRNSGRLQIFNPQGEVQSQWEMNEDIFIDGLVLDRAGHLYTIESSDIFRYDLATGERLNEITFDDSAVSFSGIATTADNKLVAINRIRGQIIRYDENFNPELVIRIEDVADATNFENVAVDGGGNIYVLGTGEDALNNRQEMVFKFNSDGQNITRFGQTGSEPGSFRAPNAIAVDGQGRVYVGDIFGIHIFNNNGTFLDFFKVDGSIFDIKINDQGQILVTNRTTIFKYELNLE